MAWVIDLKTWLLDILLCSLCNGRTDWKVTLLDDHGGIVNTTNGTGEVRASLQFFLAPLAMHAANSNLAECQGFLPSFPRDWCKRSITEG